MRPLHGCSIQVYTPERLARPDGTVPNGRTPTARLCHPSMGVLFSCTHLRGSHALTALCRMAAHLRPDYATPPWVFYSDVERRERDLNPRGGGNPQRHFQCRALGQTMRSLHGYSVVTPNGSRTQWPHTYGETMGSLHGYSVVT